MVTLRKLPKRNTYFRVVSKLKRLRDGRGKWINVFYDQVKEKKTNRTIIKKNLTWMTVITWSTSSLVWLQFRRRCSRVPKADITNFYFSQVTHIEKSKSKLKTNKTSFLVTNTTETLMNHQSSTAFSVGLMAPGFRINNWKSTSDVLYIKRCSLRRAIGKTKRPATLPHLIASGETYVVTVHSKYVLLTALPLWSSMSVMVSWALLNKF